MSLFPNDAVFGIQLRTWCIYGSLIEMVLFIVPSAFYLIVWDQQQEDNRFMFGIILLVVLTLSVFLLMGSYFKDPLFILIWIIGTIFAQFVVNLFYAFLFIISMSSFKVWGYSLLETVFTILQTGVGIFLMWIAIGYYNELQKRNIEQSLERMRARQHVVEADVPTRSSKKSGDDRQVKWKSEEPHPEGKSTRGGGQRDTSRKDSKS